MASKPVVSSTDRISDDLNRLMNDLFNGSSIKRYEVGYIAFDYIAGNSQYYQQVAKKFNLSAWSQPEVIEFLWWVTITRHTQTAQQLFRAIINASTKIPVNQPIDLYVAVFSSPPPFTSRTQFNPVVRNGYPSYVVLLFGILTNREIFNQGGPYEYVSKTLDSNPRFRKALEIILGMRPDGQNSYLMVARGLGICEPEFVAPPISGAPEKTGKDVNINVDTVIRNLLLYSEAPNFDWQMTRTLDASNEAEYLNFSNKRIADYFGLPRTYHTFLRRFDEYININKNRRSAEQFTFVNLNVAYDLNKTEYIVGYGIIDHWFPVNISQTKTPYFFMPNFVEPTYMRADDINNLIQFLSNPINVPDRFTSLAAVMVSSLRRYSENVQQIGILLTNLFKTNANDAQTLIMLLVWAYAYTYVTKGLQKNGQMVQQSKEQRTQRARKQIDIFNELHSRLSPAGEAVFRQIPNMTESGDLLPKLPIAADTFEVLAKMENICWGYKGEKMHGTAHAILIGMFGEQMKDRVNKLLKDQVFSKHDPDLVQIM